MTSAKITAKGQIKIYQGWMKGLTYISDVVGLDEMVHFQGGGAGGAG